jgi:hypothetical protein
VAGLIPFLCDFHVMEFLHYFLDNMLPMQGSQNKCIISLTIFEFVPFISFFPSYFIHCETHILVRMTSFLISCNPVSPPHRVIGNPRIIGRLHVRFCVRISVLFRVRFYAHGLVDGNLIFLLIFPEMCLQAVVIGIG